MPHRTVLASALCLALPGGFAAAHPHIFVDAEVEIVFDASGAMSGVQLTWVYDDFFSFLIVAELGIDGDGDMTLSPAEAEALSAFVLDWPDDFGGDLQVTRGAVPLALGSRQDAAVDYDGGRVRETHLRPLAAPVPMDAPVQVQVFDPYYYTAYDVVGAVTLRGASAACDARLQKADLHSAYSLVEELLYGRPASDVGPEEDFPEVGYAFADTVTVSCRD